MSTPSLSRLRVAAIAVAVAGVSLLPQRAEACFMRSPLPVQVWLDHIHVQIRDQVAVKTYDCTFKNANPQAVVGGVCYMELEPGAQVDDMSVWIDGKETKAEILDVEKAKQVFNDIVKNGGSPALLEYYGNQLIQTQVPRVAPNGTVTVKLTYTTVLKKRGGLVRLQALNTNPKASLQPLKAASVTVDIKSADPIKNVYRPTHEIALVEKEGWDISVNWKKDDYLPKHPFVLYYDTDESKVGASLLAHRELDEDGHFMLLLSPTMGKGAGAVTEKDVLPKDVVFCVDTSGSMLKDGKMDQAREALEYCVSKLRDGDRFNIVDFSTTARHFDADGLVELDDASRAKAAKYVAKLHARGGTAIDEALELSLKHLNASKGDRLKMIVFATDGLPTIGERDPEAILRKIAKSNTEDVRIFVFGEGFDVNTKLLDFLALDHRGEADYILPEEDISQKISRFFDRVGSPVMTDVKVKIDGLEVEDVYPRRIPDLFRGEQVVVYGRYSGHGPRTLTVTGQFGDETRTFSHELEFPEYSEDDKSAFVPRLWAGQKVDHLLNELRKQTDSPEQELVDEVTHLAKRYGIITPYTSFLVTHDDDPSDTTVAARRLRDRAVRLNLANGVGGGGFGGLPPGAPAPAGDVDELKAEAVTGAKKAAEFRGGAARGKAIALDDAADEYVRQAGRGDSSLEAVRYIGSRAFYKRGANWEESLFERGKHDKDIEDVEIGSEKFLALLKKDGRLAKYMALGDVTLKVDKRWYRFRAKKRG